MDAVEEIKSRLSIDDVVGRYVDLKRSGASLKGLCPFHAEKTPSFYVTPSKGIFKCFGCGKAGDVFSFIQEVERVDFPEALRRLAEQSGVSLPERSAERPSLKNRLYEANEAAATVFHEILKGPRGDRARVYLRDREFGPDAIELFRLGYAPAGRDTVLRALREQGFEDHILAAAGLVYEDDTSAPPRDRFRARIIFPIMNAAGKVVGFGGRAIGDDSPKYLNSPQTDLFDKSSVLFGVHRAGAAVRAAGRAVLVEGYLDAVRAHLAGYENVVASLGTSVTVGQLTGLGRLTETVIIALDPDPAGQAAAARTALTALAELTRQRSRRPGAVGALELRIATLPAGGGDPDDLIRARPEVWEHCLEESVPAFDFYFDRTLAALDRSGERWRQEAIDRLLPVISQFASSTGWQATWLQRLARETGVDPSLLQRSMPAPRGQPARHREEREQPSPDAATQTAGRGLTVDAVDLVERGLLTLLLKLVVLPADAVSTLQRMSLSKPAYSRLLAALLAWQRNENFDFDMFLETLAESDAELARELYDSPEPLPPADRLTAAIEVHVARARHHALRRERRTIELMLGEMDEDGRGLALQRLSSVLESIGQVERELHRLGSAVQARTA